MDRKQFIVGTLNNVMSLLPYNNANNYNFKFTIVINFLHITSYLINNKLEFWNLIIFNTYLNFNMKL
jgi:hypothetical protein